MTGSSNAAPGQPSPAQGRLCLVLAALLWSLSGAFTKVLTRNTALDLNTPLLDPWMIAFYRIFFAGLVLLPLLRRKDFSFRPAMIPMVICFAAMNALFLRAMTEGSAANAILLQYTAPMWMFVASVFFLGEPADRSGLVALLIGLCGIAVIIWGGWEQSQLRVIAIALGSGLTYGGVVIFLRVLRQESSRWLTILNHLGGALVLVPFIWQKGMPTWPQLGFLFLFGAVQMGFPYWLMARSLRVVSPQEAGTITLLEPLLNPFWAYLAVGEEPTTYTFIGGIFILGALAWRYRPRARLREEINTGRRGNQSVRSNGSTESTNRIEGNE